MNTIKTLVLVGTALSLAAFAAPALALDSSISRLCGPDGPETYKRPGGYCEQLGYKSLVDSGDGQRKMDDEEEHLPDQH